MFFRILVVSEERNLGGSEVKSKQPQKLPLDFLDQIKLQLDELSRAKQESEKKAEEYLDKLRRLQADMDNLQKMTKRQVETITKQASESLLQKLLPIIDALQQAGKIAHENSALPPEEIAVGLNMLQKQLTDVLRSEGLEQIPSEGRPFDPAKHEAINYVETDEVPENTVIEELRHGYMLNGTVIRPSLVVVSRAKSAEKLPPS
jgi:molecular chaperone GrpE